MKSLSTSLLDNSLLLEIYLKAPKTNDNLENIISPKIMEDEGLNLEKKSRMKS